jgi:WD40 repeat protein
MMIMVMRKIFLLKFIETILHTDGTNTQSACAFPLLSFMSYLHHHLQHTHYQLNIGQFRVWDVRAMENVHTLSGHTASISAIHFSENGYIAATGDL